VVAEREGATVLLGHHSTQKHKQSVSLSSHITMSVAGMYIHKVKNWQWKCERLKCQTLEEESIQLSVKGHPAKGLPFQRKYALSGQGKHTGR